MSHGNRIRVVHVNPKDNVRFNDMDAVTQFTKS